MIQRCRLALAFVLAALVVHAVAAPVHAQVVRSFTSRFTTSVTGDLTFIANTLMTCSGAGCGAGQNASGGRTNNDDFAMVYVDVDGNAATFNSSNATLSLPAGANVLWAGLYWGGSSSSVVRNTCRLATPGASYATVAAAQLDALGSTYSAVAEVTALVRAGGSGTYQVSDVQSTPGVGGFAGWSLVVVYELAADPVRFLTVRDGFAAVTPSSGSISIPISGFVTPSAGQVRRHIGAVVYDGDNGTNGDRFTLNGVNQGDGVNAASNPFNSTISMLGNHLTAKNPDYLNQLGFDADLMRVTGVLPGGSSSQTLGFSTSGDSYHPAAILFAVDMYAPVLEGNAFVKNVVDLDGAPARPGDLLEYTVTLRNAGNDAALETQMMRSRNINQLEGHDVRRGKHRGGPFRQLNQFNGGGTGRGAQKIALDDIL